MNNIEQVLLDIIKESLFGIDEVYPNDIDWNEVIHEAQEQAIDGLILDTCIKEKIEQWQSKKYQILTCWINNLSTQQKLIDLLADNNIASVILKGTAAAIYYPHPYFRRMGDIDIIVPSEKFDMAASIMEKNGYVNINKDYARHYEYIKDGMEIELHRLFTKNINIEKYITAGLAHAEIVEINGFHFSMLPDLENGLVLLEHIKFHLISEMGIRQVLDWMMYVDKVLSDQFWDAKFEEIASALKLDVLAITITRMCQMYLGLNKRITWCKKADEKLCKRLMEIIISSGNFGRKQGNGTKTESIVIEYKKGHFFRFLQKTGEKTWMAYKHHSWLKPLCWFYQILRFCRHGFSSKRENKFISDVKRGKERFDILKEMNIYSE